LGEHKQKHWRINATISIDFGSDENAHIFEKSYTPETNSLPTHRSVVELLTMGSIILIKLKADDVTALRAAINSVLQFAQVVDATIIKIDSCKAEQKSEESEDEEDEDAE
jgi:tRNA threonylcarbamoyladenosine modification (KEOPS) complex  Pcc1 subunit